MKKLVLTLLLAFAAFTFAATAAYGDDDHHRVSGVEMGAIGAVGASVIGAVVYLLRKRHSGPGK